MSATGSGALPSEEPLPFIESSDFGRLDYTEDEVFVFPAGLPGFDTRQRFLLLTPPLVDPFCFLQSVEDARLRFICLPVARVHTSYQIALSSEEAALLDVEPATHGTGSTQVAILCVVTVPAEGTPTANMLAPIVLALQQRRGAQCIRAESGFSVEQELQVTQDSPATDPARRAGEAN